MTDRYDLCRALARDAGKLAHRGFGTASTKHLGVAREAGADEVIDYTTTDFETVVKDADVVYDSVGKTTFERGLDCLRPRGLMVLFGQSSGPVPPFDLQLLNRKGSLYVTRPTLGEYTATRAELHARARDVL